MKYAKKIQPTDKNLSERMMNDGWKKIKEPPNLWSAVLFSMPIAFFLGSISLGVGYLLNPSLFDFLTVDSFEIVVNINIKTVLYIIILFVFMMIHELIHAVWIPNFSKSDKTYFGINGLFGFVFTREPLKKSRFILISIMPFIILSVILPMVLNLFQLLNGYTMFLCMLNAMGSCVDFFNAILIGVQVPNGRTIVNNGFETYYK